VLLCSPGSRSLVPLTEAPAWFDSHCHLHLCEENADLDGVVDAARAAGVEEMVAIGIDAESSQRVSVIARDSSVYFSAGVHPNSADEWNSRSRKVVEDLLSDDRCVAVGETGLDFYRDAVEPSVQQTVFIDHIELARQSGKALVIHTRASAPAALDLLEQEGPPDRLVFHCWSGSAEELERALHLGSFISFAGNVSFKSAQDLRDAAKLVPPERLLVETDSPFLAPVPHRGQPNEPAYVRLVGEAVAAAREEPVQSIASTTSNNARVLFQTA
jgi:TatD DNase family protein